MNKHLIIVCVLPTSMFLCGGFLTYIGFKYKITTNDNAIYNVGIMFILGAIAIALQSLYSIYWG